MFGRRAAILCLGLSAALVSCGDGSGPDAGFDRREADTAAFQALTARAWFDAACPEWASLPAWTRAIAVVRSVRLNADGTYHRFDRSDVRERFDEGEWNFRLRTANAGVLYISDGSVFAFELLPGRLILDRVEFCPDPDEEPLAEVPGPRRTHEDLPRIQLSPAYRSLIDHSWKKTNNFDLAFAPDEVTFSADGAFHASYRGGECEHSGVWSINGEVLYLIPDAHPCSLRDGLTDGGPGFGNVSPDGENLHLDQADYSYSGATGTNVFVNRIRTEGNLILTGEYEGSLSAGQPTPMSVRITTLDSRPWELHSLVVTLREIDLPHGSRPVTDTTMLLSRMYEGATIRPGQDAYDEFVLTPDQSGEFMALHLVATLVNQAGEERTLQRRLTYSDD